MDISPISFLNLLQNMTEAVSRKELAMDYDDLLREIFEEGGTYDAAEADTRFDVENLPTVNDEKFFWSNRQKEELLAELLDLNDKRIQLSEIAIGGESGTGKSTLARLVYEDEQVKEMFDLQIWVKVDGQEFNLQHAAHGILKSTMGISCSIDDQDELDEMVRDTLQWQRCLIVFDGIEYMEEDSWLYMNQYWFDFVDLRSKVIVTTPSKDVAGLVANQQFELTKLSRAQAEDFLREYLPHGSSCDLALLFRCIPLPLKLVGSLVRYDIRLMELLSSLDWKNQVFPMDARVVVLLCVWSLPPHLRLCLAYCALFPRGYSINKEKIIDMWIATGLVKPSPGYNNLEDTASAYFRHIECRSFFTDITCNQYGDDFMEFRIPGLIHEMLEDVARVVFKKKIGLIASIAEDAAQISVDSRFAGQCVPEHLEALILSPTIYLRSGLESPISEFNSLKSLDLSCSGIQNLSEEICMLKELRYLNLSYTLIESLPDSITILPELHTLDLSFCYHIKVLPKDMCRLTRMRHLDLSFCESLSYLPSGIDQLICLMSMPLFVLGKDGDCASLRELGMLNRLRGRLEIRNLETVRETSEARDAKLDKKYLHYLGLTWSQIIEGRDAKLGKKKFHYSGLTWRRRFGGCYAVLEQLEPNPHLEVLELTGYMGFQFPKWISSMYGLIKISITDCGCKELPSLGHLPFLKELQLKAMIMLKRIGPEFYGDGDFDVYFPSLEQLELYDLPRLREWTVTAPSGGSTVRAFISLQTLTIQGCPMLLKLPSLPTLPNLILWNSDDEILSSPTGFTSLSSLVINDMVIRSSYHLLGKLDALTKLILHNIKDEIIYFLDDNLPGNLNHLGFIHCHKLTHIHWWNKSFQKLHIVDCPNLTMLSHDQVEILIVELVVEDCPRVLPIGFHKLPSLRKFIVKNCDEFSIFDDGKSQRLEKLEYLFISGCKRIESELHRFPMQISHVPCIIMGGRKVNYEDFQDLSVAHSPQKGLFSEDLSVAHSPQKELFSDKVHGSKRIPESRDVKLLKIKRLQRPFNEERWLKNSGNAALKMLEQAGRNKMLREEEASELHGRKLGKTDVDN